jgi:hypothetical protein
MSEYVVRQCREEAAHKAHYWGDASEQEKPYRCPGDAHPFFYLDWDRQVRRFQPPGPDQVRAARGLLAALGRWEEMPDTAGSRWAMKFVRWLADYGAPGPDDVRRWPEPEPDLPPLWWTRPPE